MRLIVGHVGHARGLRGEVVLDVQTDEPERRFAAGQQLLADGGRNPLVVAGSRVIHGRWCVRFAGIDDRTAAEALRGVTLAIDVEGSDEADAWYPDEIKGLQAVLPDGTRIGEVAGVDSGPAQDLLRIARPGRPDALVPFVRALVPVVDVAERRIVVDPPAGLLDL